MYCRYLSPLRFWLSSRLVMLVVAVGLLFCVFSLLIGYGCSRSLSGFSATNGLAVSFSRVISPGGYAGLIDARWEYEKVTGEELLAGLTKFPGKRGGAAKMHKNRGSVNLLERSRSVDSASGRWRSVLDPKNHEMTGLNDRGDLVLYETVDESHDARTAYDPPLILLYDNQETGLVYSQDVDAVVWSLKSPERRVDYGRVYFTVEYEGDESITTPATGRVSAHRFHTTETLDFRRADVVIDSTTWYVDGFGEVATLDKEKVRVFGFVGWDDYTALRLVQLEGR